MNNVDTKAAPLKLFLIDHFALFLCRLYLINSPVVRAENLRFKEEGVRDILKDVLLPWYNAYRFLVQNVVILQHKVQIFETCDGYYLMSFLTLILNPERQN